MPKRHQLSDFLRRRRAFFAVSVATAAVGMFPSGTPAATLPGSLDASFGSGGVVTTTFPGYDGDDAIAQTVVVQPDGKIVAAGGVYVVGSTNTAVVRYNPDGTLDPTFGVGGRVVLAGGGAARALALTPDGKILVDSGSVARLNPDGTLDPTFGAGGLVPAGPLFRESMIVDGAGRIIIGAVSGGHLAIERLNSDGSADTTFGSGGIASTTIAADIYTRAFVLERSDGTLVVVGVVPLSSTPTPLGLAVAQFGVDGTLDTTFGAGGAVLTDVGSSAIGPASARLQADGKLVVALQDGVFDSHVVVMRFDPDGSLDPTFGNGGRIEVDRNGVGVAPQELALAAGGDILVAGYDIADTNEFVVRLKPDGQLDQTFGIGGWATTSAGGTALANALALQPDGNIVTAGEVWTVAGTTIVARQWMLTRFFANASDTSPPAVKCGAPDAAWHGADAEIVCTATDDGSGLARPDDASFTLSTHVAAGTEDANAATSSRTVCDVAGNCATAGPIDGNRIDKAAPAVACGSGDGAWHNADVSIACTASDGGSGLASAGDAAFALATNVASGAFDASASTGSRSVCDAVGNCATAGPIGGNRIDKQAPVASCASADSAWHANNVSIACTAGDGGAGLAPADASFAVATTVPDGTEDANAATASRSLCDLAGNCVTVAPVGGNKIDRKPPAITVAVPAEGATYTVGQALSSSFACSDGGSGYVSCSGSASVATGTVGPQSFTVTANDAVGNVSTKIVSYGVRYASGTCNGGPGRAILQPINADGTSVFKRGSTVPAKFRVCDAAGASVGTPGVVTAFKLVQTISSTVADVNEAVYSTTPDTAFRWDATDKQWIFNISTTSLAAGTTYVYRITLNDGSTIDFRFSLK